jgi:two-component system sensor histidine kinase KdpD
MPTAHDTQRGSLKVYLGYAAGVGKTFQMLGDAHAAAQRAVDVVVAYFQPHARADTIAQVQSLELVPHGKVDYRGRTFEEMDTAAVLRRKPQIAWWTNWHTRIFLAPNAPSAGKTFNSCWMLGLKCGPP